MKKLFLLSLIIGLIGCNKNDGSKQDGEYMLYCQKMIKRNAQYPETVDYKNFDTKIVKDGNEIIVVMPFATKNGFGVPSSYKANCTMNIDGTNQQIYIQ